MYLKFNLTTFRTFEFEVGDVILLASFQKTSEKNEKQNNDEDDDSRNDQGHVTFHPDVTSALHVLQSVVKIYPDRHEIINYLYIR